MHDDWHILERSSWEVAPRLLGCWLVRELAGKLLVARIVETEAYDQTDAASHSYHGKTTRNGVMFGQSGHLYVYFTYGMHHCCNVVTGPADHGSAVLVRAVEPIEGESEMRMNRHGLEGITVTNGPAKLCQALQIDTALNGHDLHAPPLQLVFQPLLPVEKIVQTTRIGIRQAADVPWRFYIKDSPFVSKV